MASSSSSLPTFGPKTPQTMASSSSSLPPFGPNTPQLMASSSSSLPTFGPTGIGLSRKFFTRIAGEAPLSENKLIKISIVGVGNVGMAIVHNILAQHLADELTLVGATKGRVQGEVLDLNHAARFLPSTKINGSVDYIATANSDLCILTAGAHMKPSENRFDLLQRNIDIFKQIVPQVAKHSPNCLLLVVTNPVDVLTYVAWKLSGFPANRVIGSGTNLDSARFQSLIADYFGVNAQDVQGYIVGEHGDSSVALWSSLSVGGVPILKFLDQEEIEYTKKTLDDIHKQVVNGAYEVVKLKGCTSSAIGLSVANLARTLLRDQRKIHPVSVLAKGVFDLGGDVFLSLPVQLGREGVLGVPKLCLTNEEILQLKRSADTILKVQSQCGIC